jgi:HEXXH motif-containing protein
MNGLNTLRLDGIDQPNISQSDVKDYLSRAGVSSFLKQLLRHKQQKNVLDLLGHAAVVETELPSVAKASGFLEYFEKFKTLKSSIVCKIWSAPAAYHWILMNRMLLDATIFKIARPKPLEDYLAFLQRSLSDGLATHLNDFGRFVLAAFLLSGREISVEEPVRFKLPGALPGTNLALLPSPEDKTPSEPLRFSALTRTILEALTSVKNDEMKESCSIFVQERPGQYREVIVRKMPLWRGPHGVIRVDSFEPCLTLPYVEVYPRVQDPAQCQQFFAILQRALHRLANYDSRLVDEMSFITSSVTPMDAGPDGMQMYSGTSSTMFGACFLSVTSQPLFVAEMLLHEFCHNKLRLLQEVVLLLSTEQAKLFRFYSPWRDDPRPLDGIQHGLYVFSSIAGLWLSVWKDENASESERELAQRRIGTLLYQLEYAIVEFRAQATLDEWGRLFLEEISRRIQELKDQTDGWDFHHILPFFSGVIKDQSLKELPIAEALPKHRLTWEASFRA